MRLWSFLIIPFFVALTYGAPVEVVQQPAEVQPEVPAQNVEPVAAESAPVPAQVVPVVVQKDAENVPVVNEAPAPVPEVVVPVAQESQVNAVEAVPADEVVEDAVATTISPVVNEEVEGNDICQIRLFQY